jgi:hypothetical protein
MEREVGASGAQLGGCGIVFCGERVLLVLVDLMIVNMVCRNIYIMMCNGTTLC